MRTPVGRSLAALFVASFMMALAAPLLAQSSPATLGGALPSLFPVDNWWNQDVSQAPVAVESPALIGFLDNGAGRRLHPEFGGIAGPLAMYGIP